MPRKIDNCCNSCGGSGMTGSGIAPPAVGGARRRQFHMLQDMRGIDPRQNAVVNSLETEQQRPAMSVGAGMGFRDVAVRKEHRDRARLRAIEDPRYSVARGNPVVDTEDANAQLRQENLKHAIGGAMKKKDLASFLRMNRPLKKQLKEAESSGRAYNSKKQWYIGGKAVDEEELNDHVVRGGGFWGDLVSGVKSVANLAKPLIEPLGNALGSRYGVANAGTIAKGLFGGAGADSDDSDNSDDSESMEGGRKKASPGSGRNARNVIVRRIMAEKGLKMIEASKYVKAHGLY